VTSALVAPPEQAATRRGRLAAALAGAAALCLGFGAHLLTSPASAQVADAGDVPAVTVAGPDDVRAGSGLPVRREALAPDEGVPHGGPARSPAPPAVPRRPPAVLLPPTRLRVAAARVDAPIVPVAVDPGGALDLPQDPAVLGWWAGGADPGAGAGTVVVAGHIDTKEQGAGVMARVIELPLGATIELAATHGGLVDYTVVAVRSYPKAALPASIFTRAGRERLALVTCGGDFDAATHHYSDNVVVYAVPSKR